MDTSKRELLQMGSLALLGSAGILKAAEQKGMFVHVFLMKFKPEVPEEEIADAMKELAALKEKIPVLKEFLVGKNVSPRGQGYHYTQVAILEKKEDVQAYQQHPEHRKVIPKIAPNLAESITMQFEPL